MEFQQLRYLVALARERNFRRAAKRASVTQPTLSQQIKKLEEEIGVPLFERAPKGVQLTEAGQKLLPHAQSILARLEAGLAEFESDTAPSRLTVAAIPTLAPYILPKVILRLKKEAPLLRLEIYEETTAALMDHLKEGGLDLGILALPVSEAGIVSRSLGREKFYAAIAKSHPLARKKKISRKDISRERLLILREGHCFSDQSLEYCGRSRDDDQVIFQGTSLTSVMLLAATGEGITLVPAMATAHEPYASLNFIPFTSPAPFREIGIVWRVTAPPTPARQVVTKAIEEVLRPILSR